MRDPIGRGRKRREDKKRGRRIKDRGRNPGDLLLSIMEK